MNRFNYFMKYTEYLGRKLLTGMVQDHQFHSKRLKRLTGRTPDLVNPVTLSEKICYRMMHDHNPLYTRLADKLAVRDYVATRTQKVQLPTLLCVYDNVQSIDFSQLPDKFVLKCNHDSGSAVICTDKDKLNIARALQKLDFALRKNMYYTTREWQYKNIKPVILCEKYIDLFSERDKSRTPEMLRIHCFHGIAGFIEADFTDDAGHGFINVYNRCWQLQPFQLEYPNTPGAIPEPELLHKAITAAQELSTGIDYCRIDLMLQRDVIYFSEITLSPRRGKLQISPPEWDTRLGEMWNMAARQTNPQLQTLKA
ncbi:ATP-grasp fold amidoligase family protein [Enterobacter sp. R4-368]|uniref:ATP-grasp fold amidoligase family protein n=1 Tax=Enterobacter sp. R4-368 TaxID=1166130 RepID=UPI00034F1316|nr:ATP-grasp fold amidoligase family protein [Enterobacter sp. R4-368]AGN83870.1 hypothetical protein H650_01345 [Enterobacter sp. R4-368]